MTDTTLDLDADQLLQLAAARARRRLIEAPGLVAYIRTLVVPPMGGTSDGMPRASSKTPPLPMRADAVDDSDDTWSRILYWISYWAAIFDHQPPSVVQVHWAREGEAAGFRAETTPAGAGRLLHLAAQWLLARHDRIALHDDGATYFDDVADMVWQLRAKYPRAPRAQRGVLERPCPACDRFTFGASWVGEDVTDFELRCSFCEHTEPAAQFIRDGRVKELMHELREEHADPKSEWWTKRQAQMELEITKQTLNRYIVDGLGTYTVGGTVYVNTEDLLALWRQKRLRQRAALKPTEQSGDTPDPHG